MEIGNGPFRLGIMGFFAEIPTRVTVNSVPPFPSVFRYPSKASFGDYIAGHREKIRYIVG